MLISKIFLSILIQGYLERPNTVFDLIYVLLLRIGRQGKTLIEKGRRDSEKLGTPGMVWRKHPPEVGKGKRLRSPIEF